MNLRLQYTVVMTRSRRRRPQPPASGPRMIREQNISGLVSPAIHLTPASNTVKKIKAQRNRGMKLRYGNVPGLLPLSQTHGEAVVHFVCSVACEVTSTGTLTFSKGRGEMCEGDNRSDGRWYWKETIISPLAQKHERTPHLGTVVLGCRISVHCLWPPHSCKRRCPEFGWKTAVLKKLAKPWRAWIIRKWSFQWTLACRNWWKMQWTPCQLCPDVETRRPWCPCP